MFLTRGLGKLIAASATTTTKATALNTKLEANPVPPSFPIPTLPILTKGLFRILSGFGTWAYLPHRIYGEFRSHVRVCACEDCLDLCGTPRSPQDLTHFLPVFDSFDLSNGVVVGRVSFFLTRGGRFAFDTPHLRFRTKKRARRCAMPFR